MIRQAGAYSLFLFVIAHVAPSHLSFRSGKLASTHYLDSPGIWPRHVRYRIVTSFPSSLLPSSLVLALINPSTHQPINSSAHQSINSNHQPIKSSIHQPINASTPFSSAQPIYEFQIHQLYHFRVYDARLDASVPGRHIHWAPEVSPGGPGLNH